MNVSREDYEQTVARWRALGEGHVNESALPGGEGRAAIMMAMLMRRCLPDEAVHVAGWIEVQSMLADGSHYGRSAWADEIIFTIYLSRPVDEQDAIPVEVPHGA